MGTCLWKEHTTNTLLQLWLARNKPKLDPFSATGPGHYSKGTSFFVLEAFLPPVEMGTPETSQPRGWLCPQCIRAMVSHDAARPACSELGGTLRTFKFIVSEPGMAATLLFQLRKTRARSVSDLSAGNTAQGSRGPDTYLSCDSEQSGAAGCGFWVQTLSFTLAS